MGWVWRDDDDGDFESASRHRSGGGGGEIGEDTGELCSTRTVVRSQCRTEEVEPGKFVRKCEKTEEVLRNCLGKPLEVIKSNKEYAEEDVTDLVVKGLYPSAQFEDRPLDFPGLQRDIEGIESHFLGGLSHFFEAAEEMKSSIFDTFGEFYKEHPSSSPSRRRGIPIEDHPQPEVSPKLKDTYSGDVDLSSLGKDV